jgi:hypothetical protein
MGKGYGVGTDKRKAFSISHFSFQIFHRQQKAGFVLKADLSASRGRAQVPLSKLRDRNSGSDDK